MIHPEWYIYHNQVQKGPMPIEEVRDFISSQTDVSAIYFYKLGWQDWRLGKDCLSLIMAPPPIPSGPPPVPVPVGKAENPKDRRQSARTDISGQIIIHNHNSLVLTEGVNISKSGIFIATKFTLFEIGETLHLTCKLNELPEAFNATAVVVRRQEGDNSGYGVQFEYLDPRIEKMIETTISKS